jgi:hypothetical protein
VASQLSSAESDYSLWAPDHLPVQGSNLALADESLVVLAALVGVSVAMDLDSARIAPISAGMTERPAGRTDSPAGLAVVSHRRLGVSASCCYIQGGCLLPYTNVDALRYIGGKFNDPGHIPCSPFGCNR